MKIKYKESYSLNGTNVKIEVISIQNGGLRFSPIPEDMLRTFNATPQVYLNFLKIKQYLNN